MAAYAAAIPLRHLIGDIKKYYDVFLPASFMQTIEFADKELKSFQDFMEKLDSRRRKRMSASLGRIAEAISEFNGVFESHFEKTLDLIIKESASVRRNAQVINEFLEEEEQYLRRTTNYRRSSFLRRGSNAIREFGSQLWAKILEKTKGSNLKRDTKLFIEKLNKTKEECCYCHPDDDDEEAESSSTGNCKMVGLRDQFNELKEQLVSEEGYAFFVVGMTGIGKTTLAREIFEDFDIVELFVCRAWVTIGGLCDSKEMIKSILAQVDPHMHETAKGLRQRKMVEYLKKGLEGKLTLIVLDDIWEESVVDFLKDSFSTTRSIKFLLTTTSKYVAEHGRRIPNQYINMRLMNKEESWDLLRVKVFGEESCPPQLLDVGKKIADKCDGLPLTIITIANLLSEAGKTLESLWIEVATKKKHQLFTDAYDDISKVLYPLYQRICFDKCQLNLLYMGVFPQKYEIPHSQLTNLWIAEDLPLDCHSQPLLTNVDCIQHLASCSLIMVYKRSACTIRNRYDKRAKACGLHSSWWHLCQREARKINFLYALDCPQDGLEEGIKDQSRLSIRNNVLFAYKDVYNSIEENCASTAQSLLCFGPYHQYQVPICFGLKLLKRLDALNIRFYEFPLEVLKLVRLRYLALTCNDKLPPSISKLLRLQFLIVHQCLTIKSQEAHSYLPTEIWDIKRLQHLQIMGNDLVSVGNTLLKLKTLLGVSADSCTKGVLERIPSLNKLGIQIELRNDATEPLRCFDHISLLQNLKSLKCVVVNPKGRAKVVAPPAPRSIFPSKLKKKKFSGLGKAEVVAPPVPFSIFPSNLTKLNLSGLGNPWEEMKMLSPLPNLRVLKLRCNAFEGPDWEVEKDGFQALEFLLIEDVDLVQLKGKPGSFKHLSSLRIEHCYKLKKLNLEHCRSLLNIDVVDSNPLVEKEVKAIVITRLQAPAHFQVQSSWKS